MIVVLALSAVCLVAPVNGPVVADYSAVGRYEGHWGVDFGASPGTTVVAPVSGVATFAGSVAGMKTVTIQPVPGVKVSTSYLSDVLVTAGRTVEKGQVIGRSGLAHGRPAVHLSARVNGRYVDPKRFLGCPSTNITRALRLITPPTHSDQLSTNIDVSPLCHPITPPARPSTLNPPIDLTRGTLT